MTEIGAMIQARGQEWLADLPETAKLNLVRISAAYCDNHVRWQVVANEGASDGDLDEYSCVFSEVLADFSTATGDEEVIRVKSPEEADQTEPLSIAIYP